MNTQVTQILMCEMEAMRMRTWNDRIVPGAPGGILYGLRSLGTGMANNGVGASLTDITTDNEDCLGQGLSPDGVSAMVYRVTPFAAYGTPITLPIPGKIVAKVGEDLASGSVQMRIPSENFRLTRYVYLYKSDPGDPTVTEPDTACIFVRADWTDGTGTHSRGITTTASRNGINDY